MIWGIAGDIYNISSGKALPSMNEFFSICEYFGISPHDFFDTEQNNPPLISKVKDELQKLDDDDILLVLTIINRLNRRV